MNIRKFTAALLIAGIAIPGIAFAQTADDAIADILAAMKLNAPAQTFPTFTLQAAVSAGASTTGVVAGTINPLALPSAPVFTPTPPKAAPAISDAPPTATSGAVAAKPSQDLADLKSLIAVLTTQVQALIAKTLVAAPVSPRVATSTATSSAPVATSTVETAKPALEAPPRTFTFSRVLKVGSRGDDVSALQRILIAQNFLFGEVTGYFGNLTRTALRSFQTDRGLQPVGFVGPQTREVLNGLGGADDRVPTFEPIVHLNENAKSSTSTPLTLSFKASATGVLSGAPVDLIWKTTGADTCEASNGWFGKKGIAGTETVNMAVPLSFVLTCHGANGWITSTTSIRIATDEKPPIAPASISVQATSQSQVDVWWSPSTDDIGINGYVIYRDDEPVATTTARLFSDIDLQASTTYSYFVRAVDFVGKQSAPSRTERVTTPISPAIEQ